MPRFRTAVRDTGQIPAIVWVNQAKLQLGPQFRQLAATPRRFLDRCFEPVWGATARPSGVLPCATIQNGQSIGVTAPLPAARIPVDPRFDPLRCRNRVGRFVSQGGL